MNKFFILTLFLLATFSAKAQFTLEDFYKDNKNLDNAVNNYYNSLDLDERAAQMIMPAIGIKGFGLTPQQAVAFFKAKQAGGFLLLKGTPAYFKDANALLEAAAGAGITSPILSCDGEAALIHYKFVGTNKLTPAAQQTNIQEVRASSKKILDIIQPLGLHINFAPIVDNNTNKAIIGNRSFGANAAAIVPLANTFIYHHQTSGVVAVAKHFPGHGAVVGDSHKGLVNIDGELTELEAFREVIQKAKPIGVMVGHIAVKNNTTYGTNGLPSTLSRTITTQLLKEELGFKGIVFTDALNMGAVSKISDAAFKSACAGSDILLMPLNVPDLHKKIKAELSKKSAYSTQFETSIKKVLRLKYCLGLLK